MKQTAAFLNSLLSSRVASSTTLGCLCSLTFIASAPVAEASNSHQGSFNVQTYGAKGDGVTDDTSAIQAALAAAAKAGGGTVIFPNGQYLYSDALTVSAGISLTGPNSGVKGQVAQLLSATTNAQVNVTGANTSISAMSFSAKSTSPIAINVIQTNNFSISNNNFLPQFKRAIKVGNSASGTVSSNNITSNDGIGVSVNASNNIVVERNTFRGTVDIGVEARSCINVSVLKNLVDNTPASLVISRGIYSNGSNGNQLSGNDIFDCTTGIGLQSDTNDTVVSNLIQGSQTYGIFSRFPAGGTFSKNTISGGDRGIQTTEGSDSGSITENTISDTRDFGIDTRAGGNVIINGNNLSNCGQMKSATAVIGTDQRQATSIQINKNVYTGPVNNLQYFIRCIQKEGVVSAAGNKTTTTLPSQFSQ